MTTQGDQEPIYRLTSDRLLPYPGFHGTLGICHVRVYRSATDDPPVVIVGDLDGAPWTSVTNAIEAVAGEVCYELLDGDRRFRLIEYNTYEEGFTEVKFEEGEPPALGGTTVIGESGEMVWQRRGARPRGAFSRPTFTYRSVEHVEALLGQAVKVWERGEYTAESLFGADGARVDQLARERGDEVHRNLLALIGEMGIDTR